MSFNTLQNTKFYKFLNNTIRGKTIIVWSSRQVFRLISILYSDIKWNDRQYFIKKHMHINLYNPLTFSDKVFYLKFFYRNPLVELTSDKYYVRDYVRLCGYPEILNEIYAVYGDVSDIEWKCLPQDFFMKCNHASKFNLRVKKDENFNVNLINRLFNQYLNTNYYPFSREWNYKRILPKLIIEKTIIDGDGNLPIDYKFYCFEGKAKYFMVSYGEYEHNVRNHKFDMDFNSIDYLFKERSTINANDIIIPLNFDMMINIVNKLASPFPHVRIDLYNVGGKIIFGEMTHFTGGGIINVFSSDMDQKIGSWINLDRYKNDFVYKKKMAKYRIVT